MAQTSKDVLQEALLISVDDCRVRVQTGEPILFLDARRTEDWVASKLQIAGAVRLSPDERAIKPPCHKRNYIVVYCG